MAARKNPLCDEIIDEWAGNRVNGGGPTSTITSGGTGVVDSRDLFGASDVSQLVNISTSRPHHALKSNECLAIFTITSDGDDERRAIEIYDWENGNLWRGRVKRAHALSGKSSLSQLILAECLDETGFATDYEADGHRSTEERGRSSWNSGFSSSPTTLDVNRKAKYFSRCLASGKKRFAIRRKLFSFN